MKRKIIALILAVGMVLCLIPPIAAAAGDVIPEETLAPDQVSDVPDEPADTGEGPVRSAGGQYRINIYYNSSAGSVVAMVDDVVAASADGGDLVYLTITPGSGYEFQSAGVVVMNSDGEYVMTVPQADGTISFLMPDSSVNVTVQFTIAEDVTPPTPTVVERVSLFVDQPSVGETTDTEDPDVTALEGMYEVTAASWADSSGNALSAPLTFESGMTYYIAATVITDWESWCFFPQVGLTVEIENGSLVGEPSITNVYGSGSTMEILIAVQPVMWRPADQIQVWVGNIDGNTTMDRSGGKVATNYTPSEPDLYGFGKSGEYKAADIVQFYTGDEITVTAEADAGYRFVGWYRVNIDYDMNGGDTDYNGISPNKAYSGSAFSAEASFTYKPGETILPGDTEPLRYVCAVFEEAAPMHNANEIQVWIGDVAGNEGGGYSGGKVAVLYTPSYDDYPEHVAAKDGTVYEYGQIFGCYEGDNVTLYAQPDAGYGFVGWYLADGEWPKNGPNKYTGDMLSDQTTYTFEFTGANRLICAVFGEDAVGSYTVSFDPGTGTGSMDPVTVDAGAEYELPPCTFTHTNAQRSFYKWSVDDELMDPGDTITVSEDTEVIAKWYDTGRTKTIDNSVDRSTSEVAGTLKLTDTRTGEVTEVNAFDEVTASEFTQPSNVTVQAMIGEAKESTAAKAQEIADGHDVTIVSESVSDPQITRTIDNRTLTYFVDTDEAGDYAMYLIVDGEWAHLWRYDVTVEAEYTSVNPQLTLHWSSIDGDDLAEPVKIEFTPGMTFLEVLGTKDWDITTSIFEREGYRWNYRHEFKPVSEFAKEADPAAALYQESLKGDEVLEDDTDVYCIYYKEINFAEVTIEPPACGTETTTPPTDGWWKWEEQTNRPVFSTPSGGGYHADGAANGSSWVSNVDADEPFIGTFKGGQEYSAEVWLEAEFGYVFDEDPYNTYGGEIAVSGATLIRPIWNYNYLLVLIQVAVEHDPDDMVVENRKDPSCGEAGSYDEVVYCKGCNEELSRETGTIPATGQHIWNDGVVAPEPTCTEDGVRTFTCTVCNLTRTEIDPAKGHSWDNGVITKEPTCTEAGERVVTCMNDKTHTQKEEIAALGHDWGEWKTVKEPTETEDGKETRTCPRCGETETNIIPRLVVEYRNTYGEGSSWEKGSTESLYFAYERSLKEETTFSHFTGIQVDGADVDPSNYTAVSGSVIITLPPAYLDTLTAGKHTLTALFDDADADTAGFNITEKAEPTLSPTAAPTPTPTPAPKASPDTGDNSNPGLWGILFAASLLGLVVVLQKRKRY